jgi:hypothetical protein
MRCPPVTSESTVTGVSARGAERSSVLASVSDAAFSAAARAFRNSAALEELRSIAFAWVPVLVPASLMVVCGGPCPDAVVASWETPLAPSTENLHDIRVTKEIQRRKRWN